MGAAIGAWARIEEELSLVFVHAIGAPFDAPARAVFYSVRSFEARLGMTQAAVNAMWPVLPQPGLGKEWNALYNRLRDKNKSRNEIAHSGLISYSEDGAPSEVYADPYLNLTSRRNFPAKEQLRTRNQIDAIRGGFDLAAIRLSTFETELALHLGRQPTSLLRVNHPDPEVRNPAIQSFQEFAKRRPPFPPTPDILLPD